MENNKSLELVKSNSQYIYSVKLNLEQQTRYIAKLNTVGDGTILIKRTAKHLFRKTNSLGVNYQLLADERIHYKWIIFDYCGKQYTSTREYFLNKGQAFQFSKKGFELQIFVPLDELNIEAVKKFELSKPSQGNLFEEMIS